MSSRANIDPHKVRILPFSLYQYGETSALGFLDSLRILF